METPSEEPQSLRKKLEPSDLQGMFDKLRVLLGDRLSVSMSSGEIRLDNNTAYSMVFQDKSGRTFLTEAGEFMLGVAEKEGADNVTISRIKLEMANNEEL
jgi:hypothetical protein